MIRLHIGQRFVDLESQEELEEVIGAHFFTLDHTDGRTYFHASASAALRDKTSGMWMETPQPPQPKIEIPQPPKTFDQVVEEINRAAAVTA